MSTATAAVAAYDSSVIVQNRIVLEGTRKGQILPKKVIVKAEDDTWDEYDFDDRGRVCRMVRFAKGGKETLNRAWPAGTSLHELGLHEVNREVQRFLAKNRREQGGMGDVAA